MRTVLTCFNELITESLNIEGLNKIIRKFSHGSNRKKQIPEETILLQLQQIQLILCKTLRRVAMKTTLKLMQSVAMLRFYNNLAVSVVKIRLEEENIVAC